MKDEMTTKEFHWS